MSDERERELTSREPYLGEHATAGFELLQQTVRGRAEHRTRHTYERSRAAACHQLTLNASSFDSGSHGTGDLDNTHDGITAFSVGSDVLVQALWQQVSAICQIALSPVVT